MSKTKPADVPDPLPAALARLAREAPADLCGAWVHKGTGAAYRVLYAALNEADLAPVVVYRPADRTGRKCTLGGSVVWVRPLAEFLERFEREAAPPA